MRRSSACAGTGHGTRPAPGLLGPSFPPGNTYLATCQKSARAFAALLEKSQKACDLVVMIWSSGEIPGHVSLSRVSCVTPTPNDPAPFGIGPSYAIDSNGNIVTIQSEEHWNQIRRTLLAS